MEYRITANALLSFSLVTNCPFLLIVEKEKLGQDLTRRNGCYKSYRVLIGRMGATASRLLPKG